MKPTNWFEKAKSEIIKYIGSTAMKVKQLVNLELDLAAGFFLSNNSNKQSLNKKKHPKINNKISTPLLYLAQQLVFFYQIKSFRTKDIFNPKFAKKTLNILDIQYFSSLPNLTDEYIFYNQKKY